jgi:uncharacterized membrane protein YjgN (DUF898 family)
MTGNTDALTVGLALLGFLLAAALLLAVVWCNWKAIQLRETMTRFRGDIRVIAGDRHKQIKMVNALLAQVLTFSSLSLLPKITRLPLRFGRHLLVHHHR